MSTFIDFFFVGPAGKHFAKGFHHMLGRCVSRCRIDVYSLALRCGKLLSSIEVSTRFEYDVKIG